MDDKSSKNVGSTDIHGKSSSTSESSEYELVENNLQVINPVVSNNVSEDLINDAIGSSALNSPTAAADMIVGKSIFYDCNDKTNSDTDDEGSWSEKLHSFVINFKMFFYFSTFRCANL